MRFSLQPTNDDDDDKTANESKEPALHFALTHTRRSRAYEQKEEAQKRGRENKSTYTHLHHRFIDSHIRMLNSNNNNNNKIAITNNDE